MAVSAVIQPLALVLAERGTDGKRNKNQIEEREHLVKQRVQRLLKKGKYKEALLAIFG
jgi:hypothetical protein